MNETPRLRFYRACRTIVRHEKVTCLNYCIPYAKAGLAMWDKGDIETQILYILSNMNYWRGEIATETRNLLKEVRNELTRGK